MVVAIIYTSGGKQLLLDQQLQVIGAQRGGEVVEELKSFSSSVPIELSPAEFKGPADARQENDTRLDNWDAAFGLMQTDKLKVSTNEVVIYDINCLHCTHRL